MPIDKEQPSRRLVGRGTCDAISGARTERVVPWGGSLTEAVAAACVRAQLTGRAQRVSGNGLEFVASPDERVSTGLERWTSIAFPGRRPDGWLEVNHDNEEKRRP